MTYYAIYNMTNETISKAQVKCLNADVENIEVSKDVYDNLDRYIYQDGLIVENPNYEQLQANARKEEFLNQFFKIDNYGYFRKQPKGYGSAVESLNTAFNVVTIMSKLPANTLTFYAEPDFAIPEQCTEEWLVANSTKNAEMNATEFGVFYSQFMTSWNEQEHQ